MSITLKETSLKKIFIIIYVNCGLSYFQKIKFIKYQNHNFLLKKTSKGRAFVNLLS